MISPKNSFKGLNILYFCLRNKAKVLLVLNNFFPYNEDIKIVVTSIFGFLTIVEELVKYFKKRKP